MAAAPVVALVRTKPGRVQTDLARTAGIPRDRWGSRQLLPWRYRLFRIGDAVSSRNIHAAVYDAIRLMKDI